MPKILLVRFFPDTVYMQRNAPFRGTVDWLSWRVRPTSFLQLANSIPHHTQTQVHGIWYPTECSLRSSATVAVATIRRVISLCWTCDRVAVELESRTCPYRRFTCLFSVPRKLRYTIVFLPPPKEVMFYFGMFVKLSVCFCLSLCPSDNLKKLWTDFVWRGGAWPRDQWVQFWWRSRSPSGSRSPKSEIRIHWIIELPTYFDEILRRAGVWPGDQLIITFRWTIRITIRIRESVPDHDPDPGRTGVKCVLGLAATQTLPILTFKRRQ